MYGSLKPLGMPIKAPHGGYVALYGTLMRGQRNYDIVEALVARNHMTPISRRLTLPGIALVDIGGLPAVYPAGNWDVPAELEVRGELYRASNQAFELLDMFEGVPTFYQRSKMHGVYNTLTGARKAIVVNVYSGPRPGKDERDGSIPFGELLLLQEGKMTVGDWARIQEPEVVRRPAYYHPNHRVSVLPREGMEDPLRHLWVDNPQVEGEDDVYEEGQADG